MEGLSDCFPHSYAEPHVKVGARGRLSQPSGHRAWPPTRHPALETTPDFLSSEPLFTKTDVRARGADVSRGEARARGAGPLPRGHSAPRGLTPLALSEC